MGNSIGCRIKRYAMTSFDAWQTNFVPDSIRCGTNRKDWHRFGAGYFLFYGFAVVAHVILGLEPGIPLSPILH